MEPMDYPEAPTEQTREMREIMAAAETNAPRAMLRAQRQWDRMAEEAHERER